MKFPIALLLLWICTISAQMPSIKKFGGFDSPPYLTPTFLPSSSVNINWNTARLESTVIAYDIIPALEETVRISGLASHHHIMLTNLLPGTDYYYKIVPYKEVYRFRTAPEFTDSVSFIVLGDTRSDSISHQAVVDRIAQYDFDFLIHAGDLVVYGDDTDAWRKFFNIECAIISKMLFIPTIGNHERPYWQYDTLLALPGAEYYYSVNYGNCHIICLNTEMQLTGPQRNWLINDLIETRQNPLIDWIFVTLHRPPYSSGSHGSQMDVRNAWCSIFSRYGVDIVFCGHDHSYERTRPIDGVIYIICGGGGAPLYDVRKSEWTAYSEKTHHFCLVEIKRNRLELKAIKPDGMVFDSLVINKF